MTAGAEKGDERRAGLRRRLYRQLDPAAWPQRGLSPVNKAVCALILLASTLGVLETERSVTAGREAFFSAAELVLTLVFLVEYLARVWTAAENPRYGPGWRGRLRYMRSPAAVLDLLALTPILLVAVGNEAFLLRFLRLLRVLRIARLGRFSQAMRLTGEAVSSRLPELALSVVVAMLLLLVSSTFLYLLEGSSQPVAFGSIPRAMWWSVATLTTVGYGDVYPVTVLGRIFAGATAVAGIGLIAMPTGILAAAMSDALHRRRLEAHENDGSMAGRVPHPPAPEPPSRED